MRYDTDRETLMLSAQELCLLSLRHGDLDGRSACLSKSSLTPAVWGKICSEAGASYQQNTSFYYHLRLGELSIGITSEADGLYRNDQKEPVVDLVRPVSPRGVMAPPDELHPAA